MKTKLTPLMEIVESRRPRGIAYRSEEKLFEKPMTAATTIPIMARLWYHVNEGFSRGKISAVLISTIGTAEESVVAASIAETLIAVDSYYYREDLLIEELVTACIAFGRRHRRLLWLPLRSHYEWALTVTSSGSIYPLAPGLRSKLLEALKILGRPNTAEIREYIRAAALTVGTPEIVRHLDGIAACRPLPPEGAAILEGFLFPEKPDGWYHKLEWAGRYGTAELNRRILRILETDTPPTVAPLLVRALREDPRAENIESAARCLLKLPKIRAKMAALLVRAYILSRDSEGRDNKPLLRLVRRLPERLIRPYRLLLNGLRSWDLAA